MKKTLLVAMATFATVAAAALLCTSSAPPASHEDFTVEYWVLGADANLPAAAPLTAEGEALLSSIQARTGHIGGDKLRVLDELTMTSAGRRHGSITGSRFQIQQRAWTEDGRIRLAVDFEPSGSLGRQGLGKLVTERHMKRGQPVVLGRMILDVRNIVDRERTGHAHREVPVVVVARLR